MLVRQIGKLLRGNATPLQIVMACILGSMLGFVPGFMQGPGLFVALLLLLIVLNANLLLAGLVGLVAKLASLALMPLSFQAGRLLLDGPTQGLFKAAINAPVLALFGFEYYATTGGLVIGLAFGAAAGIGTAALLTGFRRRMAGLEQGSERYQRYAKTWWARGGTWLLFGGGHGRATYADLLARRYGNPVRLLGVVFAVLVIALLFIVQAFASGPIVTAMLERSLERANGATVDVGSAALSLKQQRLVVHDLAVADPEALDTDLLRAATLEANLSGADLLRKRLTLDRVEITDASNGERRATPGRRVGSAPRPSPPDGAPREGEKTIDDYIKEAEAWKERLARVREWLEDLSKPSDDPAPGPGGRRETLKERLEREVREKGYARVTASHLVEGAPTLLVKELVVNGIRTPYFPEQPLDARAENLSTHPGLVPGSPRVTITSRDKTTLLADITAGIGARGGASGGTEVGAGGGPGILVFAWRGIPADAIADRLRLDPPPIRGGTIDIALDGTWATAGVGYLDLPLLITLHGTTVTVPGAGSAAVELLTLPLGLRGPIDNPAITVDQELLAQALVQAGAGELAGRVRGEAEKAIGGAVGEAKEELEKRVGGEAKEALDGLLGGLKRKKE